MVTLLYRTLFSFILQAGRLLIRKLIAENLQIPWDKILLDRTAKGKPFLVSGVPPQLPNFNFNVSHQGDYAVLAAEPEVQVGVDIMKTDRPGKSLSLLVLVKDVFTTVVKPRGFLLGTIYCC